MNRLKGELRPKPFTGVKVDAMKWLRKFEAYIGASGLENATAIHTLYMLLDGPAEDWYSSLPDEKMDVLDNIYEAF